MTTVRSQVLLPSKFRQELADNVPPGVQDKEAYRELLASCATLKVKVNSLLPSRVDNIRHGTIVDLSRNYIGAMGLQAITALLAKNANMQELRMPCSGLNNDSVVFFCRSVKSHPALTRIDFSSNDISLAGGLALLSLVQQNRHITHVSLDATQVPPAVLAKLQSALERNAQPIAAAQINTAASPMDSTLISVSALTTQTMSTEMTGSRYPTVLRMTVRGADIAQKEVAALARLSDIATDSARRALRFVPLAEPESGWRLLEVAVLAPPFLFESEKQLLLEDVFPRLNEELVACRVQLVPFVNPPEAAAGTALRTMRFSIAADDLRSVNRSRMFAIELIGDRAGDYELPPASETSRCLPPHHTFLQQQKQFPKQQEPLARALDFADARGQGSGNTPNISAHGPGAPPLRPVLATAHKRACEVSSWLIIATRRDTRRIGVPPSLAPLLTEEPPVEHPDCMRPLVRRTVAVGSGAVCAEQHVHYDADVRERQWRAHREFRDAALREAPVAELIVRDYNAVFEECCSDGQVRLRGLDAFAAAVYERLQTVAQAHFAPETTDARPTRFEGQHAVEAMYRKLALCRPRMELFLQHCAKRALSKKGITNRMDLYVVTPPSRNALLLHGTEPAVVTSLVGAFANALRMKDSPSPRVAFYTTHSTLLAEEPTDLRCVLCSILQQLAPDPDILRRALAEVDIVRLQALFAEVLTERRRDKGPASPTARGGNKATIGSGTTTAEAAPTVVVIDGLDHVKQPIMPCAALRTSPVSGTDAWGAPAEETDDPFVYIPKCLSRHVRVVLTCVTGCEAQRVLETRGRDSVELLSLGAVTPNDFDEMLGPAAAAFLGVTISDDDFVLVRKKMDALSPEYVTLVADALRSHSEVPGAESQTALIAGLPGTVREMVLRAYTAARDAFGPTVLHICTRLLLCARWGVHEHHLRQLLRLPQRGMNQLLRTLRPLLEESTAAPGLGADGGNVLHARVCIRSRAFCEVLENEELQLEGSENDQHVWHGMLLQCYLSIAQGAVERETSKSIPPIFQLLSTNAYERTAVKEIPYHAVHAGSYHVLHRFVLSMPFLMLVYRNTLGYQLVRDLIEAFNVLYEMHELDEYRYDTDDLKAAQKAIPLATFTGNNNNALPNESVSLLPSSLERLQEYIYFLRQYNSCLSEFPHLVLQIAIESADRFPLVAADAKAYIMHNMPSSAPLERRRTVFFNIIAGARPRTHLNEVTTCLFAPRGLRITTGSVDRSVCNVNPVTGAAVVHARQAPARVEKIFYCATGAYHAVICVDRTILIYDSALMKLVARIDGGTFGAPLISVDFTARGRYLLLATADLHLRVFETEKNIMLMHEDQRVLLPPTDGARVNLMRGMMAVLPHGVEDECFFATCHTTFTQWQLTPTRDAFVRGTSHTLGFTPQSGCVVAGGALLLLLPAVGPSPPPPPPPTDGAAVNGARICCAATGADAAVLLAPRAAVALCASPDERLVACALDDGSVALYAPPWERISPVPGSEPGSDEGAGALNVPPLVHFGAFREAPVPVVRALRFRAGGVGLFALGNAREMKYWALPRRPAPPTQDGYEQQHEAEAIEGVADGEFVLHEKDVTAWDVAPVTDPNGAEIVFGDSTGRLTLLRMWSPLM